MADDWSTFRVLESVPGLQLPYGIDNTTMQYAVVLRREVRWPAMLLRRILRAARDTPWRDYDSEEQSQLLLELPAPDFAWLYERFERRILDLNEQHFGVDVSYWHPMRLTRYRAGARLGHSAHSDYVAPEPAKLAFSLLLAAPDAGGRITVHNHGPALDLKAGDMVVFPAYELHSVEPVTAGERTALTGWMGGPPLR